MPQLIVTKGESYYNEFVFCDADIITIGRAASNDICPPDHKVSRYHAAIIRSPEFRGRYFIRDLSSSHSTMIKGEVVYRRLLEDGDIIEIGDCRIRYSGEVRYKPSNN